MLLFSSIVLHMHPCLRKGFVESQQLGRHYTVYLSYKQPLFTPPSLKYANLVMYKKYLKHRHKYVLESCSFVFWKKPNLFWLINKFVKQTKYFVFRCWIWWTAHWFAICFCNFPCATLSLVYSFIIHDNLFIIYRVTRGPSRFRSSSKCSLWSSVVLKI